MHWGLNPPPQNGHPLFHLNLPLKFQNCPTLPLFSQPPLSMLIISNPPFPICRQDIFNKLTKMEWWILKWISWTLSNTMFCNHVLSNKLKFHFFAAFGTWTWNMKQNMKFWKKGLITFPTQQFCYEQYLGWVLEISELPLKISTPSFLTTPPLKWLTFQAPPF